MNESFWKNKKVFVTGHTGFKGSWLCLWLAQLGAKVTGYSLAPTSTPNLFTVVNVASQLEKNLIHDINDGSALYQALQVAQPEIVFHLAAQSLVQYSYQNPIETYQTNVMGTVNVLEAARHCPSVKTVINVTSDKCYENKEWVWGYRENDRLGGHDPYSNSKACAELVTSAYRDSFYSSTSKQSLASARAGNVIGGGDWAQNRLVPDMVRGFLSNENVLIRNPNAIRPWQHVLEPLSGYMLLAEKLNENPGLAGAWNFGPDEKDVQPVKFIADYFTQYWKGSQISFGDSVAATQQNFGHEAGILKLDISKAKNSLNWRPKLNLSGALEYTIDWYQAFQAQKNMTESTLGQIAAYGRFSDADKFV